MRPPAALLVPVLLLVSAAAGVGAVPAADGSLHDTPAAGPTAVGTEVNGTIDKKTTMYISLHESGNARWNVTARFILKDDNQTAAFRHLAERYENGTTDAGFTRATFERALDHADGSVSREMSIRNVSRSGHLRNNGTLGLLSISFTWTNFSHTEGDRIVLGDVFQTDSGIWLPVLTDDQTLVIEGPSEYYIAQASTSGASIDYPHITYEGPQRFDIGDLSVTYAPRSTPTTATTTTDPGGFPNLSGTPGLAVVVVLISIALSVGAYAWTRRDGADPEPQTTARDERVESSPARRDDEPEREDTDEDADDEDDAELLSDEERVLRLLRENDGRMKQANIVKQTNWSNAKVSQLLSKMDDDGDVDKLRIGRENLITLPDEDVTEVN